MSDGHKTSTIPRPPRRVDRDDVRDPSLLAEFTRPIPMEKQLVKGRGKRIVVALAAVIIAAALGASLFVLPVKSWFRQHKELTAKQHQLDVLNQANAQLAADVNRLQTPDGIKEAARQEVGYVGIGEERISVLRVPDAPVTLPAGWPYDTVTQILAVRAASPATPDPAAAG